MPRNASGVYSLPNPPVVPDTVIESVDENETRSDMETELTNSLDRNGRGGMLAPLRTTDGNITVPGLSWVSETTSGWYRAGLNDFRFSIAGQDIFQLNATSISVGAGITGPWLLPADAAALYIPLTEKAAASGVASLDSGTKVPIAQLPTNVAGGLPGPLDGSVLIPIAQLPVGTAGGIPGPLDGSARLPAGQLPGVTLSNSLGADVALNNTAAYFTGPQVAQGSTGIFFASGGVTIFDSSIATVFVKLWDGSVVIDSARVVIPAGFHVHVALSGAIASPAGNIRISVRDTTNTTGSISYNATTEGKDSTVTAFRIG
jgi:hypothetical protein